MDLVQSDEGLREVPLEQVWELLIRDGHEQGLAQLRQLFHHDLEGPVVEGLGLLLVHEHEDGQDWESFVRRVASKADIPDCQGADIKVADLGKQGQQGHFYYYPLLSSIIQYYPLSSHIELGVVADTLKAPALFEGDLH